MIAFCLFPDYCLFLEMNLTKQVIYIVLFVCCPSLSYGQTLKNSFSLKTPIKSTELNHKRIYNTIPIIVLPPDFHTKQFGFFCKQELRLQRTNTPLVFRLGSVEMCNTLEQKPGYR